MIILDLGQGQFLLVGNAGTEIDFLIPEGTSFFLPLLGFGKNPVATFLEI